TASATYHRTIRDGSVWATTVGWGRNSEHDHDPTSGFLAETTVTLDDRDSIFGRFEVSRKSGRDLVVGTDDLPTVWKLQGGYTRYVAAWNHLKAGYGAAASVGVVPSSLERFYGGRANLGISLFVTVRPARMN